MAVGPVRKDFDRAVKNAQRAGTIRVRHAGTVAAARALADKIDHWDQIVQWAVEDMEDSGAHRPSVPQNDNVSLASFLKYMDALGLTVAADRAEVKASVSASKVKGAQGVSKLEALQKGVGLTVAS